MTYPDDFINKVICGDCLEVMKHIPDGAVDLVLTDPPYGLGKKLSSGGGKHKFAKFRLGYLGKTWDEKINNLCFNEIYRVSNQQIIWGGNYYEMPPCRGFICWDKQNKLPTFSDCEYAWTSFDKPAKLYRFRNGEDTRCHPTQKPINLFRSILLDYSQPNDLILDPFLGSGTTAVACKQLGRRFIGIEINPDYCKIAEDRLRQEELF